MAFEQFPYTNFHELNTDWVLKTLKELKTQAETLQAQAEAAIQGVEDWESRVQAAEAAAQAAETAAETAETAAQAAETAASNAENSAENSLTAATAAQTQATNAAASASTAQTQATNAAASASTAQTQATNAAASAASAITAAQAAKAGYYEITLEYPVTDQSSNLTLPDANFQDVLEDIEYDEKPIIIKLIQAGNGQGVIDSFAYLPAHIYDWDQNKIELELEYNMIMYHITWFYPGEGTSHYTRWIITDNVPPAVASANNGKFLKSTGSGMVWADVFTPEIIIFTGESNPTCNKTFAEVVNAIVNHKAIVYWEDSYGMIYSIPNLELSPNHNILYANMTRFDPVNAEINYAVTIGMSANSLSVEVYEV